MDTKIKDKIIKILTRIKDSNIRLNVKDIQFILNYAKKYESVNNNFKKALNQRYSNVNILRKDFGFD